VPERDHWLDANGPMRRDPASQKGHRNDCRYRRDERHWIVGRDVPQLTLEQAIRRQACRDADDEPGADELQAKTEDHPYDVSAFAAERHANGNLTCLLGDGVREDAIDAERHQHNPRTGKDPEPRSG